MNINILISSERQEIAIGGDIPARIKEQTGIEDTILSRAGQRMLRWFWDDEIFWIPKHHRKDTYEDC